MPDTGNRITNPYLRRTALQEAVLAGETARVKNYLDNGANPDLADSEGKTALHLAVGRPDIFKALLKHKADLSKHTREDGLSPLHLAAKAGDLDCISACIAAGAQVDIGTKPFKYGREKKATPLHIALENGQVEAAEHLIRAGADPLARSDNGWTLMHFAAQSDDADTLQHLVDAGYAGLINAHSETKDDAQTPLFLAVTGKKFASVEKLLELGADANARNMKLWTPLHEAARMGGQRGGRIAELLVRAGADINKPLTDTHQTPLYVALVNNNSRMARFLLAAGADPNIKGELGKTPLHMAAGRDRPELVEDMLKAGARLTVRDHEGNTPLHLAAKNDLASNAILLLQAGANPTMKNRHGQTPDEMSRSPRGKELRGLLRKSRKIANDNRYMKKKDHNGISPIEKPPNRFRGPRSGGPKW